MPAPTASAPAPVLILQHLDNDGPAYLGRWLQLRGIAFEVFNAQAAQAYPTDIDRFSALAVLGGSMSANDDLPHLRQAEALILQAIDRDRPVIGHCLGGQLMARALGARVGTSPAPEIGWQDMQVLPGAEAAEWLGESGAVTVMHWHHEAFELPRGASWLASSRACPHQAFSLGRHLGMQFHIEIDEPKLTAWSQEESAAWDDARARYPSVQGAAEMRADGQRHLAAHQALADRIYGRWLRGTGLLRDEFRMAE